MTAGPRADAPMVEVVPGPFDEGVDVCVVGSGAGGAVAAAVLAEAGLSVLVLEEGGFVPVAEREAGPLEAFRRMYRGGGLTATLGNVPIPMPMGRTLGGTTVVNSGTCFRTPGFVLNEWSERLRLPEMRAADLEPYFEAVERDLAVTPVPEPLLGGNSAAFRAGAEALGWRGGPIPRNVRGCRATGMCVFACPRGAKQSMEVSYLPRAHAAGARIRTGCKVEELVHAGGRVTGVRGRVLATADGPAGWDFSVRARAVVLAAGAIYSPLLLQASGLARRGGLVGENLRIHPSARVVAMFPHEVVGHRGVPQGYHVSEFERDGIFIQGMFLPPGVESPSVPGIGREFEERMERYRHLGSFGCLISDVGAGSVTRLPGGLPLMRYDLGPRDHDRMLRGIARVAEGFYAAGATEVYLPAVGHRVTRSMDDVRRFLEDAPPPDHLEPMAFHPMGTCRMGAGSSDGVVDVAGRAHGLAGLVVADASVLPGSTHTNPQVTIMALAMRAAERLAARLLRR